MFQFFLGIFLGVYLATHGVTGIASAVDEGVQAIKTVKVTTENK